MASQVMRITLKAYDHQLIDQSAGKIIETVETHRYRKPEPEDSRCTVQTGNAGWCLYRHQNEK